MDNYPDSLEGFASLLHDTHAEMKKKYRVVDVDSFIRVLLEKAREYEENLFPSPTDAQMEAHGRYPEFEKLFKRKKK